MAESTAVRPGSGATLVFTTNAYAVNITSASWSGMSRPALDTTYLGSATAKSSIPGDLYDPGTIDCDFNGTPSELDALITHMTTNAVDTFTVTFDQETGETTAADFAASGYIIDHNLTIATEELIAGSFTVQLSGAITFTAAT